jgi:hypothetical protein
MAKPKLLMLDEPSLGLAPLIVREIFRIIAELRRRGVSILLVEQNARAALQVADYAYVLETGQIAMHGPAHQLADDPRVIDAYLGLGSKHQACSPPERNQGDTRMEALRIMIDEHQSLAAILHAIRLMLRTSAPAPCSPTWACCGPWSITWTPTPRNATTPRKTSSSSPCSSSAPKGRSRPAWRRSMPAATTASRPSKWPCSAMPTASPALRGFRGRLRGLRRLLPGAHDAREREILPLVHKYFTAEDWAIANAGFAGKPDPMGGTRPPDGPEDFARIFSRLVAAAPEPIGLAGP